ncbi:hypothetical protein [Sphaerisporangium corydalis]|uniref:Uncharacterized protein n=1 Tax=Sphaerisporangium corydalis TaxID=1441875 RepID=A0ABV9EC63_9ACTN|nr:hypothetical protein [Sphaerisporangium corydalis]
MRIRSVLVAAALTGGLGLCCPPAQAAVPGHRHGSRVVTDVVKYRCTGAGIQSQDIEVKVELTVPTGAVTEQQMTIGWRGTYAGTGLTAPGGGLSSDTKLYAYASISGITRLSSATGVGTPGAAGAGQVVPLPTTEVALKTTPLDAGTGTVRAAAMNFGLRPNAPSIECDVLNANDLTTYPLTVTQGGQGRTGSPTPTTTPTGTSPDPIPVATSPRPTHTVTEIVTRMPANPDGKVTRTPAGSAETGGGGTSGPDGRLLVLAGLLVTFVAATGLLLRRRAIPQG